MNEFKLQLSRLAEPFEPSEIKFKPQCVKNNRALAMAYVDARCIQDRLDDVLGVENWQDSYKLVADGSVICRLRIHLNGHWITKTDVGSPSDQSDSGDRLKAAFSDALKRAAVKFGIGRYLYRIPAQWTDYDMTRKQFVKLPALPSWALPKEKGFESDGVNQFENKLARCQTRESFDAICLEIAGAISSGVLNQSDRDYLRKLAEKTGKGIVKAQTPSESATEAVRQRSKDHSQAA